MQQNNWRRPYENHNSRSGKLHYDRNQQFSERNHFQNNSRRYDRDRYQNNSVFDKNYQNQVYNRSSYSNNNFHHNRKPYDRPSSNKEFIQSRKNRQYDQIFNIQEDVKIPISPFEQKINSLVNTVQDQGMVGQFVFIKNEKDNSTSILQNAIQSTKNAHLNVTLNAVSNKFELIINEEVFGETDASKGKQVAKNELSEKVLDKLKKKCFYIMKKENYEEVSTGDTNKNDEPQPTNSFEGSKAYSMMLKMGWGGKGLGVQEQGEEKTVADKMVKNITKEGLGSKIFITEVDQILQDYISSSKITTLAFDSSFSKEERAQIHNLAQKYNLKSKSQGKEPDRRITISRKMGKWDLVKELLRSNLENDSYKLCIPENFQHLWNNVVE